LAQVPVLAANSGGPTESIVDGATGWLLQGGDDASSSGGGGSGGGAAEAWSSVMARAASDEAMCARMGRSGR
jgi:glycosyltransferase involved in cell wall biosynthesis